jgi:hypothetical protein
VERLKFLTGGLVIFKIFSKVMFGETWEGYGMYYYWHDQDSNQQTPKCKCRALPVYKYPRKVEELMDGYVHW